MSSTYNQEIERRLRELEAKGNLRSLVTAQSCGAQMCVEGRSYLNLSTNDYLGLSASGLQQDFFAQHDFSHDFVMSNPSSRLLTGNTHYDDLERCIADIYVDKQVLVLGSGYLVNTGVLPAVSGKGDLVVADKLVHASIIDGLRLCEADTARFRHNDMNHLESILKKAQGSYRNLFVATESVFSMDGDHAPIMELLSLRERYGFQLYLDEAHAFGVYGSRGGGLAAQMGVDQQVDYIVATLGKATASQGSFVACSSLMRRYLINKMRTLIFSTALPPISLLWSRFVVERMGDFEPRRAALRELESILHEQLNIDTQSHIIPIVVGDNHRTIELSDALREQGYWVTPIRYPTVPDGTARFRLSLSAAVTPLQLLEFTKSLKSLCKNIG